MAAIILFLFFVEHQFVLGQIALHDIGIDDAVQMIQLVAETTADFYYQNCFEKTGFTRTF